MAKAKAGPVVTDNGNFVIDAPFEETLYRDPLTLLTQLKMLTGVVEVGLFCGMAKAAYFGNQVSLTSALTVRMAIWTNTIGNRMVASRLNGPMAGRKLYRSPM
jgi:hypothetical protein